MKSQVLISKLSTNSPMILIFLISKSPVTSLMILLENIQKTGNS